MPHRSEAVQSTAHANAYVERLIGSIRRECLDHIIVVNAAGLHRLLTAYITYYMQSRTHLALEKDAPISCPVMPSSVGPIVVTPHVGGLHHRYDRAAAWTVDTQSTTSLAVSTCKSTPKCACLPCRERPHSSW